MRNSNLTVVLACCQFRHERPVLVPCHTKSVKFRLIFHRFKYSCLISSLLDRLFGKFADCSADKAVKLLGLQYQQHIYSIKATNSFYLFIMSPNVLPLIVSNIDATGVDVAHSHFNPRRMFG